jgi:ubiquinone/menaquinone biosynthesis C-methylase UbiE
VTTAWRRSSARPPAPMFHELAPYYDLLADRKDYRSEVRTLEQYVHRFGRSTGRDWLDVACGTGRHLEHLRRRFRVAGVDLSPAMLRIARRRLPGVRLYRGDMRTFRLARSFDVVSCLYSAIGHLASEDELRTTFANFARHLRPGGLAIVEPWLSPERFRPRSVHLVSARTPQVCVARMSYSTRRGRRSSVDYHYLIGRTGGAVEYVRDTSRGLLLSPIRLIRLAADAGLRARFVRAGLSPGRGLLIGQKPTALS